MSQQTTANKLYDVLTVRNFEDLKALDSRTSRPPVNDQGQPDVSQADMFSFDWTAQSGRNYGTAVILLTADSGLELYFGDNLGRGMEPEDKQDWYDFLLQIKQFATRNFLEFQPQNINRLKFSLAGQAAINEGLFESWRGTATASWNGGATEARIMIRHQRRLGENDARYRYIESVFIETTDGERYRLPFVKLSGAKAMLEHVRQGGRPYDTRGQHIASMVEEINVLSRFRRAVRGQVLEGVSASLVEQTGNYYESLGRQLTRLHTARGYQQYFESWSPAEVSDQDIMVEDLRSMFVEQSLDTRIEAALPVLARIHQGKNMKEVTVFEQWVNGLVEGTWSLPELPKQQQQLIELMSQDLPVGADAVNATQQLSALIGDDELFDRLGYLADQNADADARPEVAEWMADHLDIPSIAAVYEKVPADVKPEAFMPPAQDSAVSEEQHDSAADADYDADLDSILRAAGVPAQPKAAPDYQTGVMEMDNRSSSGDRQEQRANSPEAIAQRKKEQQDLLKKTKPEHRKKLGLPEPDKDVSEGSAPQMHGNTTDQGWYDAYKNNPVRVQVKNTSGMGGQPSGTYTVRSFEKVSPSEAEFTIVTRGQELTASEDLDNPKTYVDRNYDTRKVFSFYSGRMPITARQAFNLMQAKKPGAAEGSLEEVSLDLVKRARDKAEDVIDWDYDDVRDKPYGHTEKQRSKFQRYIDKKEPRAKGDRDWDPPISGVAEGHADQQRKIFKKNGKPVGEVGIDRESSPGLGQWYMKHYASGTDLSGYDSYNDAVDELKYCMKQGVTEGLEENAMAQELDDLLRNGVDYPRAVKVIARKYNTHTEYVVQSYEGWGNFEHDDTFDIKEQGVAEDQGSGKIGKKMIELGRLYARARQLNDQRLMSKIKAQLSQLAQTRFQQGLAEDESCNMSEDGTMCPTHGLAECGISEDTLGEVEENAPADHQSQDPIQELKSLLGRFRP